MDVLAKTKREIQNHRKPWRADTVVTMVYYLLLGQQYLFVGGLQTNNRYVVCVVEAFNQHVLIVVSSLLIVVQLSIYHMKTPHSTVTCTSQPFRKLLFGSASQTTERIFDKTSVKCRVDYQALSLDLHSYYFPTIPHDFTRTDDNYCAPYEVFGIKAMITCRYNLYSNLYDSIILIADDRSFIWLQALSGVEKIQVFSELCKVVIIGLLVQNQIGRRPYEIYFPPTKSCLLMSQFGAIRKLMEVMFNNASISQYFTEHLFKK